MITKATARPGYLIPEQMQKRAIFAAVLMDSAVFSFTILIGYLLCGIPSGQLLLLENSFDSYQKLYIFPLLAAPAGLYFSGMYRRDPYRLLVRSAEKAFFGSAIALVFILVFTYMLRGYLSGVSSNDPEMLTSESLATRIWGIPMSVLLFTAVFAPVLIAGWRFVGNRLEAVCQGFSRVPQKLLIIGTLDEGELGRLRDNHSPCYKIVGTLCADKAPEEGQQELYLGTVIDTRKVLEEQEVDEILLVSKQLSRGEKMEVLNLAAAHSIRVWVIADVYDAILSSVSPVLRGSTPIFQVRETIIRGWVLVIKRLIDIFVAGTLLTLTAPLLIIPACIAIVIESKGFPVFAQRRVGVGGRLFKLYKLRTMVIDAAQKGPALTEDNDPRITRVGAFLRRTSIDELPQLWNVLLGSMSLIGPRAVVPYVADRFEEWERVSLNVRPGLTGLAQVSGRDEIGFREKSLLNIYYVRNYSLWLDLRIFFATILVVASMEGTGGTRDNG